MEKEIKFTVSVLAASRDLNEQDKALLDLAKAASANAYAPYSKFKVGAAILLENNKIVTGSNQENASFPAGICAEGTALSVASSLYPGVAIAKIAITATSELRPIGQPVTPCGVCRQKLVDYEERFGKNIEVIMSGEKGEVYIVKSAMHLLPLHFSGKVF